MGIWVLQYWVISREKSKERSIWSELCVMTSCSHVMAFSHFPLSMINTKKVVRVFKRNRVYWHLCGHLHGNYGDDYQVWMRRVLRVDALWFECMGLRTAFLFLWFSVIIMLLSHSDIESLLFRTHGLVCIPNLWLRSRITPWFYSFILR